MPASFTATVIEAICDIYFIIFPGIATQHRKKCLLGKRHLSRELEDENPCASPGRLVNLRRIQLALRYPGVCPVNGCRVPQGERSIPLWERHRQRDLPTPDEIKKAVFDY